MKKFIFTFGSNHPFRGRCQIVHAPNSQDARELMNHVYGNKWGFQYTAETWETFEQDKNRQWDLEKPLFEDLVYEKGGY